MMLDRSRESDVTVRALDIADELGLLNHEVISGLLKAAFRLAEGTSDPDKALDEAATLFADGFPETEDEAEPDEDPSLG